MQKKHIHHATYVILFILVLVITPFVRLVKSQNFTYESLSALTWNQDQTQIATAHLDKSIRITDTQSGEILLNITESTDIVESLAFNSNGTKLASFNDKGIIEVWSTETGQSLLKITVNNPTILYSQAFRLLWNNDDTKLFAMTEFSPDNVTVWDVTTGQLINTMSTFGTPYGYERNVTDGTIIVATSGHALEIRDGNSFGLLGQISEDLDYEPSINLSVHPEESYFAAGNVTGQIQIFAAETSQIEAVLQSNESTLEIPLGSKVQDLAFNSLGDELRAISTDGTLRAWNTTTWQVISDVNLTSPIYVAKFSPDGNKLAYANDQGNLVINTFPIANAGTDQTVGTLSTASVTLDGSGSSDVDGSIVSYVWKDSTGAQVATGVSPTVDLPVGVHTLTLTVTNDDGATASDDVVITVVKP